MVPGDYYSLVLPHLDYICLICPNTVIYLKHNAFSASLSYYLPANYVFSCCFPDFYKAHNNKHGKRSNDTDIQYLDRHGRGRYQYPNTHEFPRKVGTGHRVVMAVVTRSKRHVIGSCSPEVSKNKNTWSLWGLVIDSTKTQYTDYQNTIVFKTKISHFQYILDSEFDKHVLLRVDLIQPIH